MNLYKIVEQCLPLLNNCCTLDTDNKKRSPTMSNHAIAFYQHPSKVFMHPLYTESQLQSKSLSELKAIYTELGAAVEVSDKRTKSAWVNAIVAHQSTQVQKVDESVAVASIFESQTVAQAELNQYIDQQAEEIAPHAQFPMSNVQHLVPSSQPKLLTPNLELPIPSVQFASPDGFYNWEAAVEGKTIATIHYDSEYLTQRYVVAVGSQEVHRTNTQAKAENYIRWHYKQGTLPVAEEEKIEPCTIEDCKYVDNKGQQYAFRINNQLIGYI